MNQRARLSPKDVPPVVDIESTPFRVASAVSGPGYILVNTETKESSFWLATTKPTPEATLKYGNRYLSFVSDVVTTNKVTKDGLMDDLFFLWRTGDVQYEGGAWAETGRFAKSVNNSEGRYFTREAVADLVFSANREGVDPEALGRYIDATMDPISARHWKSKLGVSEPEADASAKPTGLRHSEGSLDRLIYELRQEWCLKLGRDYAFFHKYGRTHLLCPEVFLDTVQECAAKYGVAFASVSLCERLPEGSTDANRA